VLGLPNLKLARNIKHPMGLYMPHLLPEYLFFFFTCLDNSFFLWFLMLRKMQLVSTIEHNTQESLYSRRLRTRRSVKSVTMSKLGFVAAALSSVTFTLALLILIAGANKHILPSFYFFKVVSTCPFSHQEADFVSRQMPMVLLYQVLSRVQSG